MRCPCCGGSTACTIADLDFDATTGLRFHPLEILLSLGFKAAVVVLLGAMSWAVVAFEVLLNAASVFNHGNVALPERLDRWLRWIVVTPDMHRVHHSTCVVETNRIWFFGLLVGSALWDLPGPAGARTGGHGHRPERLPGTAYSRSPCCCPCGAALVTTRMQAHVRRDVLGETQHEATCVADWPGGAAGGRYWAGLVVPRPVDDGGHCCLGGGLGVWGPLVFAWASMAKPQRCFSRGGAHDGHGGAPEDVP